MANNSNFKILVQAMLDEQVSFSNIQEQLNKMKFTINIGVNVTGANIQQQVQQQIQNTQKNINSTQGIGIHTRIQLDEDAVRNRIKELETAMMSVSNVKVNTDTFGKMTSAVIEYKNQIGQVIRDTMRWTDMNKTLSEKVFTVTRTSYSDGIEQGQKALQGSLNTLQQMEAAASRLNTTISSPKNGIKDNAALTNMQTSVQNVINKINDLKNSHTIMSDSQKREINSDIEVLKQELKILKDIEAVQAQKKTAMANSDKVISGLSNKVETVQFNAVVNGGLQNPTNVQATYKEISRILGVINQLQTAGVGITVQQKNVIESMIKRLTEQVSLYQKSETAEKQSQAAMETKANKLASFEERLVRLQAKVNSGQGLSGESLDRVNNGYNQIIQTIERYRNTQEAVTNEEVRNLRRSIVELELKARKEMEASRTAEKGFNYKQYTAVPMNATNYNQITSAAEAYNTSLLRNHKLLSASVSETDKYLKISQQLQQGNYIKSIGVYVDKATGQMYQFGKSVKDNLADTITWEKALVTATKRMVQWAVSGALVFGTMRVFKDAINYIVQMDTALTNLNKVVDMSAATMNKMRLAAISLGKELGQSSVDIAKGMAEWGRFTKNTDEIINLTRTATMAANVTDLSVKDASQALISTMITFKLNANDSMKILDQWNEIQNNFKTTAEDLAHAIGTVGVAASQSGTGIQELEGYVTSIVAATGMGGSEVGTAIKSMISRVFRIGAEGEMDSGKAEEQLSTIGVAVRKADGNFRAFGSIIDDVAQQWGKLSNVQQLATAQAIAGTHHYSKFMALMNNYGMAVDATTKAYNSHNSAMDENQKHLNSIQGRMNQLKVDVEGVFNKLFDGASIKTFIGLLGGLVGAIDYIIANFGGLTTIVGVLALSFTMFSGNVRGVANSLLAGTPVLGGWMTGLSRIRGQLHETMATQREYIQTGTALREVHRTQGLSTTALNREIAGLRMGLLSMQLQSYAAAAGMMALQTAMTMGVSIIITGLVTAITAWINKAEEAARVFKESVQAFQEQQTEVARLVEVYKQNAELAKTDDNAKQQLLETEKQLKEAFGNNAKELDLQNGKLEDNLALIKKANKEKLNDFIQLNRIRVDEAEQSLQEEKYRQYGVGFTTSIKHPFLDEDEILKKMGIESTGYASSDVGGGSLTYKKSLEQYFAELTKIKENAKQLEAEGVHRDYIVDMLAEYEIVKKQIDEINKQSEAYHAAERQAIEIDIETLGEKYQTFDTEQQKLYASLKEKLNVDVKFENVDKYKQQLEGLVTTVGQFNGKNINETRNALVQLGIAESSLQKTFDEAAKKANEGRFFKSTTDDAKKFEEAVNAADQAFKKSIDTTQTLNTALQELSETHDISGKTLESILMNYPQLMAYMGDEAELSKQIGLLLQEENERQVQLYQNKLLLNEDFFNKTIKGNAETWNLVAQAYETDAQSFKNIADLKKSTNDGLLQDIAKAWGTFYGSEEEQLQAFLDSLRLEMPFISDQTEIDKMTALADKANLQLEAIKKAKDAMANITKKIDFGKLDVKPIKTSSKTEEFDQKYVKEYNAEVEKLNQNLESLNGKYKALESTGTNFAERQDLLNQIIETQRKKLEALHSSANNMRAKKTAIEKSIAINPFLSQDEIDVKFKTLSSAQKKAFNEQYKDWKELSSAIAKAGVDWWSTTEEIFRNESTKMVAQFDGIQERIKPFEDRLANLEQRAKALSDTDAISQATIQKEKIQESTALVNQYIIELENLQGQMPKNSALAKEFTNKIEEINQKLAESRITTKEYYKSLYEIETSAIKSTEDKLMEIIKKKYDLELDRAEQIQKKREEIYDKDLDSVRKYISDKIRLLDEQYTSEDYQQDLQQQRDKELDIQKKLNELKLDDSIEATAKRKALETELEKQQYEIAQRTLKHDRELRKSNLQQNLSDKEKEIEDKKQADSSALSSFQNQIQKLTEEGALRKKVKEALDTGVMEWINTGFNIESTDVKAGSDTLKQVLDDNIKTTILDIGTVYKEFDNTFGTGMTTLGQKIQNDFLSQLTLALQAMKELDSLTAKVNQNAETIGQVGLRSNLEAQGFQVGYNGETKTVTATKNGITTNIDTSNMTLENGRYRGEAADIQNQLPIPLRTALEDRGFTVGWSVSSGVTITKNGMTKPFDTTGLPMVEGRYYIPQQDLMKQVEQLGFSYANGGIITQNQVAALHGSPSKWEAVLNQPQLTKLVSDAVNAAVQKILPTTTVPKPAIADGIVNHNNVIQIENLVKVEGNIDKDAVPDVQKAINDSLQKIIKDLGLGGVTRKLFS